MECDLLGESRFVLKHGLEITLTETVLTVVDALFIGPLLQKKKKTTLNYMYNIIVIIDYDIFMKG